jgi:hypothetical protein
MHNRVLPGSWYDYPRRRLIVNDLQRNPCWCSFAGNEVCGLKPTRMEWCYLFLRVAETKRTTQTATTRTIRKLLIQKARQRMQWFDAWAD